MNMIVRRVSGNQRRTIQQSQGGFQEPRFLNRFLSKFLCRHKEIFCISNPRAENCQRFIKKSKFLEPDRLLSETFVRAKVSDTSKALVDNLTVFYVFSLGLPKLRPACSTNAGRSLFSWIIDGKADYLNRSQRCQPENCSVPVSKSQPSVKMIVRRMSRTPRRTIRQNQGDR